MAGSVKRLKMGSKKFMHKRTTKKSVFPKKVSRVLANVNLGKGFPSTMTMQHKYSELVNLTTTGSATSFFFSANGMFDPNTTGIGHQPRYFGQMKLLYNHYTVTRSQIKVTYIPQGNTNVAYMISLTQNDNSVTTGGNSPWLLAELQNGQVRMEAADMRETPTPFAINHWNAAKVFAGDPLSDNQLSANGFANPPEQTFWEIALRPADSVSVINLHLTVEIVYTATWDELQDIEPS